MKDKVFKMVPSPLRPGPSFRRSQFRRTMSKTEADVTPAAGAALAAATAAASPPPPQQQPPVVIGSRDEDAFSGRDDGDSKGPLPPARGIQVTKNAPCWPRLWNNHPSSYLPTGFS